MSRRQEKRPQTRFAHIPGLGPAGKTCGDCEPRQLDHMKEFICHKAARMAGLRPEKCRPVAGSTSACKYWEERREEP